MKSRLIIFYEIVLVLSLIFLSCSLYDWANAINNTDKINPKWDASFKIPVIDKTISLKDYIGSTSIAPYTNSIIVGNEWPPTIGLPGNDLKGSIPITTKIDFDNDGFNDFSIKGVYSKDASLTLKIWLTDSSSTVIDINPGELNLTGTIIKIEGVTYTVGSAVKSGPYLYYYLNNFLSPAKNYFLDLGGDTGHDYNSFDIEQFTVDIPAGTAVYTDPGNFTLHFEAKFDLGSSFGIAGTILNASTLLTASNVDIPLNILPMDKIDNFKFDFDFNSKLAFDLNLNIGFSADIPPNPNLYNSTISSGNIVSLPEYDYVSSFRNTNSDFTFLGNVLDYTNLKMNYSVKLNITGSTVLLSTDDEINIKINIGGDSTIKL